MYLRHSTVKKNGKAHTYWSLVRSVRQGRKVRQETVAYLGTLDAQERAQASALAKHFLGDRVDQLEFFDDTPGLEIARVRTKEVRLERGRAFGDVWLAWLLWRTLELDKFCEKTLARGRERIKWPDVAMILVAARLCEPSSELHIAEDWYRRTALEDLIGVDPARVIRGARQTARAQRGARGSSEEPPRKPFRPRLRPLALRCHLHVLRRQGQRKHPRETWIQP